MAQANKNENNACAALRDELGSRCPDAQPMPGGHGTTKMSKPTLDQVMEAVEADDNIGFCLACGAETYCVEPDARNYECEECGKNKVFDAEEILVMGVCI